ncbi:MAG: metallophosphoesterase family protein [Polyangia bacterium]
MHPRAALLLLCAVAAVGCTRPDLALPSGDGGGGGGGTQPPACDGATAPSAGSFRFAVFGDVRPSQPNDTANYPQAVVTSLFTQIAQQAPSFVVGTGDYMFASTSNGPAVDAQLSMLLSAEQGFAGPVYHALGNHECTGATASNCPNGNETANVRAFMSLLVPPGTTTPYYRVDFDTGQGSAKLVVIAANAWSATQAAWLETQLADPTTYTFVARHEAAAVTETAGAVASEAIVQKYPLTLELLGHWHRYQRLDTRHIVSGNGGAPLSTGHYGFVLVDLLTNGNLTVSEIDQATGAAGDTFTICPQ